MMDDKRGGEIALKVLECFFQPKFSFNDYEELAKLTGIPGYELREVIGPFIQRLESRLMWQEIMPEKNN